MSEQRIAYPNHPLMAVAWRDAITWALSEKQIVERFERETKKRIFAKSPIEAMVDQASGYREEVFGAFVDWFNKEIWGADPFTDTLEELQG